LAVLLRGVAVRFMAVLLRGVARVFTLRCEHLFSEAKFDETRGFGPTCAPGRKKNWKIKQDSCVADKEISVLFVIDAHWEI
jgi:hypothetical protein